MDKRNVEFWFDLGRAFLTCSDFPGVTIDGDCLQQAFDRLVSLYNADIMLEYKSNEVGNG